MPNLRALLALSLPLFAVPALAAEPGKIAIELNDLQQADSGCRAVFVMQNGLTTALDQIVVRVVAFDGDSHATRFLSLELGKLPVGKTRVLRFDLGDKTACTDVSRMVLDDVTACAGGGMGPGECLAALSLSSRAAAPLDY
jgi:hypothetical protein